MCECVRVENSFFAFYVGLDLDFRIRIVVMNIVEWGMYVPVALFRNLFHFQFVNRLLYVSTTSIKTTHLMFETDSNGSFRAHKIFPNFVLHTRGLCQTIIIIIIKIKFTVRSMLATDVNRNLEQNEWHFAEKEREKGKENFCVAHSQKNRIDWTLRSIDNNIVELVIINTRLGWFCWLDERERELIEPRTCCDSNDQLQISCELKSDDAARIRLLHNFVSHSHPLILTQNTVFLTLFNVYTAFSLRI